MSRFPILVFVVICMLIRRVDAIRSAFGSKTPYEDALTRWLADEPLDDETEQEEGRRCVYQSLFMVTRHGSRWPTAKHIRKFEKLKSKHLAHINWTHAFNPENEGLLTSKGEAEMRNLGERVRKTFAHLFHNQPDYHPRKYEFKSSQALRALQSATSFAMGMFGTSKAFAIQSDTMDRDYLLRFHDNCPHYVKTKKALTPDLNHLVDDVLLRVRTRLNVSKEFDKKALDSLWGACLFEATALDKLDAACSYFTTEDAEVLEYANDVEDYWEKSYGQEINHRMACVLMEDVIASLESSKVRFLFGHAETIMPVAAFLGFFRDAEHLGRNFDEERRARKWRSGIVSPFGANIAFGLIKCFTGKGDFIAEDEFIEIRHNERAMDLTHLCPGVFGSKICRYSDFKTALRERIGQCDFQQVCNIAGGNQPKHTDEL